MVSSSKKTRAAKGEEGRRGARTPRGVKNVGGRAERMKTAETTIVAGSLLQKRGCVTQAIGETGADRPVFQFLNFHKLCGRNIIKPVSVFDRAYIWLFD